jgi:hypothetical protein
MSTVSTLVRNPPPKLENILIDLSRQHYPSRIPVPNTLLAFAEISWRGDESEAVVVIHLKSAGLDASRNAEDFPSLGPLFIQA